MNNEEFVWLFIGLSTFYTIIMLVHFTFLIFYLFDRTKRKIEKLENTLIRNYTVINTDEKFFMNDEEKRKIEEAILQEFNKRA